MLFGCVSTDNLENKFAYYFYMLNSGKDQENIRNNIYDVEKLFFALEAENNIHKNDFKHLLSLYHASEIIEFVDNPTLVTYLLRIGLHPLSNTKLMEKYQKAQKPDFFSVDDQKHILALTSALKSSRNLLFSDAERKYNFGEIIDAWSKLKQIPDDKHLILKLAKDLEKGMCFGVVNIANELVRGTPNISPAKIIEGINKKFEHVIAWQLQQNIAVKLYRKTKSKSADIFIDSYNNAGIKGQLPGFKLTSEVKRFMADLIQEQMRKKQDFVARVSFSIDKSGHAVAIQVLRGGEEYRLIDNNIGVLSFSTLEEFLEIFARYRLTYYAKATTPLMRVFI
jgi:hypothetical protein